MSTVQSAGGPTPAANGSDQAPSQRSTRMLLAVCFFLSGGAGLVYEVLWSRHLHLLFGSTTESVAAVLATFMAGLGLGGHLFGRTADRARSPMQLYGLLEIGVGLYAIATPALLAVARSVFAAGAPHLAPGGLAQTLFKLVLAAVVLVPPATLMGGTLPALVRATADARSGGRTQVGLLYALNTLGAVFGTLATGFVLIEVLGLTTSMRLTALTNLGIGALVVARARRHGAAQAGDPATVPPAPDEGAGSWAELTRMVAGPAGRYAIAGLFFSGATVMLYEVVFTRVLGLVFGVSSYAFSLVLAVFLCGLALGALAAHRVARARVPRALDFALAQIALALVALVTMSAVPLVPRLVLYARQIPEVGFTGVLAFKALLALVFLLPLSFVAGLGVPLLLAELSSDARRAGRAVGTAYMINTAGTLGGSLLAGFVLVEHVGTQGALRVAVALNVGLGLWGLSQRAEVRAWGWRAGGAIAGVAAAVLAMTAARWDVMTFLMSDTRGRQPVVTSRLQLEKRLRLAPAELLFFAEGREATVAVTAFGDRTLYVNGHPDASDRDDMATQMMLAAFPLMAHPAPADVLVIGYGSGVTAGTAARVEGVARVTVVELEQAVLDASPHFHHVNGVADRDPRVRLLHEDARTLLLAPPQKWDAILSEPSNPWRAGVASLFTLDYYRAARAALKPGGVFAQWVQLYGLTEGTLRMILRTMSDAFAEVQVWWLDSGDLAVLGSDAPLPIDRERVVRLGTGPLAPMLRRYAWIGEPDELFGRFLLGTAGVHAYVEAGARAGEPVPANTDDQPLLEYAAPRGLYSADPHNSLRLLAARLGGSGAQLPPLAGAPPSEAAVWTSIATMYRHSRRYAESRVAMDRALAAERTPRRLALAADIAIESGDLRAATELLAGADGAAPGAETAFVNEIRALLAGHHRQPARTIELLDAAGELDGHRGIPRLRALVALRRGDEAMAQAERLLKAAAPGSEIEAMEMEQIYRALGDLAGRTVEPGRVAALVEATPVAGMPAFPREKALALLYERAGWADAALAHARIAQAGGALDLLLMQVEARALAVLGRTGEADAILERRHTLAPVEPDDDDLPAPLLKGMLRPPREEGL